MHLLSNNWLLSNAPFCHLVGDYSRAFELNESKYCHQSLALWRLASHIIIEFGGSPLRSTSWYIRESAIKWGVKSTMLYLVLNLLELTRVTFALKSSPAALVIPLSLLGLLTGHLYKMNCQKKSPIINARRSDSRFSLVSEKRGL